MKFTSQGGVSVRVAKVTRARVDLLRFEVSDTGIGLSPDETSRIFQPFTQASSSTASIYGGTGLGLSICKKLIEAMDGTIGVESEKGIGSKFWFEIPLIRASATGEESVGWEKLVGIRALCFDEDSINRDVLISYMRAWDMRVTSADSVAELIRKMKHAVSISAPFEVVVVSTRDKNALKDIAHDLSPKTKIVSITEFGSLGSVVDGEQRAAGADYVVAKPIKQSGFLDALVSAVSNESLERNDLVPIPLRATEKSEFKILIADDVGVNRMLTTAMLDFLGHSSIAVANGLEVLEAIKNSHFDLILMDCQMPEMDGFETTRNIRQHSTLGLRKIPIVALTANAMADDAKICLKAGMNDYISKPMKREQLAAVINKWLKPKNSRQTG